MKFTFEVFLTITSASWIAASISGLSYLDPINQQHHKTSTGSNPCNPLYWYPRAMPSYCYKSSVKPPPPVLPAPPAPPFPPVPMPIPMPYPVQPAYPPLIYSAVPQYMPPPPPLMIPLTAPMPFGMPPPVFGMPPAPPYYPPAVPPPPPAPWVPGMISSDGGINILPFSDVYTDMLEKHKQKVIRKRLEKVLNEYDDYSHKKQKCSKY